MLIHGRQGIADVFDVTEKTIVAWEAKGMPYEASGKRGSPNKYDTAACIEWKAAGRQKGYQAEKERLTREQADKVEIENMKARDELVPATEVARAIREQWEIVITQLELGPQRWAASLAAMGCDYDGFLAYLKDEIRRIRAEVAAGLSRISDSGVEPAAPADSKPVGRRKPKAK